MKTTTSAPGQLPVQDCDELAAEGHIIAPTRSREKQYQRRTSSTWRGRGNRAPRPVELPEQTGSQRTGQAGRAEHGNTIVTAPPNHPRAQLHLPGLPAGACCTCLIRWAARQTPKSIHRSTSPSSRCVLVRPRQRGRPHSGSGYAGQLWLEIVPRTFRSCIRQPGDCLNAAAVLEVAGPRDAAAVKELRARHSAIGRLLLHRHQDGRPRP